MDANLTRLAMKNLTRYLGLLFKLLVFLLVLGFALKNSHTTVFYSYLDYVWHAPLIVMLGSGICAGCADGCARTVANPVPLATRKCPQGAAD